MLFAQAEYLGGELPIDKYASYFTFTDKASLSGASGALEHSYSSFTFYPKLIPPLLLKKKKCCRS
ncbi:MAG: hypothetical protein IPH32_14840 [Bacteroidetes bacterium]|nr:hypothetical protein [Bacteroidota bacterium]